MRKRIYDIEYLFELTVAVMPVPSFFRCIDSDLFKAQGLKPKGFFNFMSWCWTALLKAVYLGSLIINRFLYAIVSLHPEVSTVKNMDEDLSLSERSGVLEPL